MSAANGQEPVRTTRVVTVAVPVLDGSGDLPELLEAVRAQVTDEPVEIEILISDSGSTDNSVEIAERYGARVIAIDRSEFSHGGTRNLLAGQARGEIICFLTQDATPASERWLQSILEGFAQADDVALVFGPHIARAGHSHTVAREMRDHFATFGGGTEIEVQRLDRSPQGLADYKAFPGRIQFFSDVNGAVAKWAWEQVQYRRVAYAEDQLIGREMIEAGFAKVFHPGAAVIHSHDYPPVKFFKRYFDEFRSLREVLGHVETFTPAHVVRAVIGLTRADRGFLRERGVSGPALTTATIKSVRHHTIRMLGAGIGTRSDKLPPRLRKLMSLERRASFEPSQLPESPLLAELSTATAPSKMSSDYPFDFIRDAYPGRPLTLLDAPAGIADKAGLTLAWILPPWSIGSGGHTTIFRIIRMMEERGHSCSIFVFDPEGSIYDRTGEELRREINEHFVEMDAPVFIGLDSWIGADVAIATFWTTAFVLRDLHGCYEKAYLVQDFEPAFYAYSPEYIWAEETYKMGFRVIAYTPWMARVLEESYGCDAEWFECGTDLDVYTMHTGERDPQTVAVYARGSTERRAVNLSLAALSIVKRRRPEVQVVLFGENDQTRVPFEAENAGVCSPAGLAEIYHRATVGMVFSLTTHSLVAQEMMASGLPVVELDGDNVSSALGASGEVVVQAAPDPAAIADAVLRLLERPDQRSAMALRAREFVEERTWDLAGGDRVDAALRRFLSTPRDASELKAATTPARVAELFTPGARVSAS